MIVVFPDGRVTWPGGKAAGVLGRSGVLVDKREGDGATPAGRFPLRRVFWRADRVAAPVTALPATPIAPDDGWCDDPADGAYNRPVRCPYPANHEAMWRDDHVYDVVVVIGHNDDPPIAGRGSAVFMHLTRPDRQPTAGCVALDRPDLLALLAMCGADATLDIRASGDQGSDG
jgi:L,D-peptidoglycan transpeptidase YkuD (ErfK/YbiS/YcfS/YnhG family)